MQIAVFKNIHLQWTENPLFVRREDKRDILLNLEDREERLSRRYQEFMNDAKTIHRLVEVCVGFRASASKVVNVSI